MADAQTIEYARFVKKIEFREIFHDKIVDEVNVGVLLLGDDNVFTVQLHVNFGIHHASDGSLAPLSIVMMLHPHACANSWTTSAAAAAAVLLVMRGCCCGGGTGRCFFASL